MVEATGLGIAVGLLLLFLAIIDIIEKKG